MEIFGSIERLMSDLYPYRYPLAATGIMSLLLLAGLAWWRGWHLVARRHPKTTIIATVVTLAIAIPLGTYLLSPLWTRTTLVEESPLALVSNPATTRMATSTPQASAAATATLSTGAPMTVASASMDATEPPSGGEAGDEMSTATPAMVETVATAEGEQPTQEPPPAEPTATEAALASEPVATEVPPAAEPEPVVFQAHVTQSGEFYGADDFHFGSGTVLIIQVEPGVYVLRFENFSVRNGPDLRVYLSTNPDGYSASDYLIGELKATDGSFNYDIPADVDVSLYRSVIIWCEPFAVLFAVAPLYAVSP